MSKYRPVKEATKGYHATVRQRRAARLRLIMAGKTYRHYKGGHYIVLDIAVEEATGELVVIYTDVARAYVWCRPFVDFTAIVPDHGPRFQKVGA